MNIRSTNARFKQLASACLLLASTLLSWGSHAAGYLASTTLHQGGDPARVIDVVYISNGFDLASLDQYRQCVTTSSGFLNLRSPFTQYKSYFNIHRIDFVPSVDPNDPNFWNDPALYGTYQAEYEAALTSVPDNDYLINVMNEDGIASATFGGSVTIYSHSDCSADTTTHELGHAIGRLADEYPKADKCPTGVYSLGEPWNINVTTNATDDSTLKWRDWLYTGSGLAGENCYVTRYAGAMYCTSGIWRPCYLCTMRDQEVSFDPVCREGLVREFNTGVAPFVSKNPSGSSLYVSTLDRTKTFSVVTDDRFLPQGVPLQYRWYVNGALQPGLTGATADIDLCAAKLGGATNTVEARIVDPDLNNYARITSYGDNGEPKTGSASWSAVIDASYPRICSFTPTKGPTGTSVTITGVGFNSATAASFYGGPKKQIPAQSFTILNNRTITVVVPVGARSGPITITNSKGTVSSKDIFYPSPVITTVTPEGAAPDQTVWVFGSNFCGTLCSSAETRVVVNGADVQQFLIFSSGVLSFNVPSGAYRGDGSITVYAPGGTATVAFTVFPPPSISSFAPTQSGIDKSVMVFGSNFCFFTCDMKYTKVMVNGVQATLSYLGETLLILNVPSGATSGPITISAPGGTTTSSTPLTLLPPPIITSVSKMSGRPGEGIAIQGKNFCAWSPCNYGDEINVRVFLNGLLVPVGNTSPEYLGITIPSLATSGLITVSAPGGDVVTTQQFTVLP